MGQGVAAENFDYNWTMNQVIKKSKQKAEQVQEKKNRSFSEMDEEEIETLLAQHNFSAKSRKEIQKSLKPKRVVSSLEDYLDDDDEQFIKSRKVRYAEKSAIEYVYDEPVIEEVKKGFIFTGDFRTDRNNLREVLVKAATEGKPRAGERLAEMNLVKTDVGLKNFLSRIESEWFED